MTDKTHPLKSKPLLSASRPSDAKPASPVPAANADLGKKSRKGFYLRDANIEKLELIALERKTSASEILDRLIEEAPQPKYLQK